MFPSTTGAIALTQMERDAVLNRTSIDRLDPNATKVTVIGVVIAKQAVRSIAVNSASWGRSSGNEERSVLNFTLRDSPRDTVNAACWGDRGQVAQVASVFRIGDCVCVTNAVARNRNLGSTQDLYSPDASSPFYLVLSVDREPRSEVSIPDEDVFLELIPLTRVPLRRASHVITLADLLYSADEMNDRHVSLLVGVQKGNTIGGDIQELRGIIDRVKDKSRIGVCLDTCHAFAAGYDLATQEGFEKMMNDFESIIGLSYLKALHLNDSKGIVGSHLDRHENIGRGKIGLDGFRRIMNDPRLDHLPMILETPETDYGVEIALLNKLCSS